MKLGPWIGMILLLPGVAAATPKPPPRGHTIERVVAFVDGEPIWLTDLRRATVTLRKQLAGLPESKRARAREEIFEQLLQREIERKLMEREAHALGVSVSQPETDAAVAMVAKQNGVDVPTLLKSVRQAGMTEAAYRAELRFQVLEAKLLRMHMARSGTDTGKGEPSLERELDRTVKRLEAERKRWLRELRKRSHISIRVRL
jgi:hypothetical protein